MPTNDITQPCLSCHESEHKAWQQSDHAKAMAVATKANVLGDFNNTKAEHYGQQALFFIEDNQYKVTVTYDDNVDTYDINYTFGHYPLQQYLAETEPGRLQILPFAWDARSKAEGGQRWYHNYSNEEIRPEDRLHWRQPLQNWNGMCADCHSDGLQRNYNVENDTFNTSWKGINVGCLSCHGDKNTPHEKAKTAKHDVLNAEHPTGQWIKAIGDKTASWHGKKRDNTFMDNCFACHSLRSPLTDGFKPNVAFLDQFTPQTLAPPMYFADGQIKEEVYVYGSFLQSKMYKAGVNCLDCHDQHTMKVKVQGNGLCLQCHDANSYNEEKHVKHATGSEGAQCVNCHMPESRYMGVDDRRDHSFKIPRPDHSIKYNTPNACVKCHSDEDNEWALDKVTKWYGKAEPISNNLDNYYQMHNGKTLTLTQHFDIINDESIDVITRATAIGMLSYSTNTLSTQQLTPYLTHQEPLLKIAAANVGMLIPAQQRINALSPLMQDKLKAVRVAAARSLLDVQLTPKHAQLFKQAFEELSFSNELSSWRGEGRLNNAMNALRSGDYQKAEKALLKTIEVDPYMEAPYINLADIYRASQKNSQVVSVLTKGMNKLPKSGDLKYAYGLHLVRQQQYQKATSFFEKAVRLAPSNEQYLYAYILSLDGEGKTVLALKKLQSVIHRFTYSQALQQLGMQLAQKAGDRKAFERFRAL
ncbi:multiheme c-type cytochrome [Thalassotalea sp. PLHSN55]|uniref:multiheme c-type cytochrome n=1 Tax=Thalassotalea sp. PLHSN55 TaxID=3435888 RepID=UPI003F84BDDB